MTFHERLDLQRWLQELLAAPPPRLRRWWQFWRWASFDSLCPSEPDAPEIVHGPLDMAAVESWRSSHPPTGKTTPADWFVWSTQPAAHPFLTRLGGVPHREASSPWPLDAAGRPRLFLGQICFLDSLDIVGHQLPGEVLLVFGAFDEEHDDLDPSTIHLEWSRRQLREPLQQARMPPQPMRIPQLTGVIHRTVEDWDGLTQGTKIGARTLFIQDARLSDEALLCAISFFSPHRRWSTVEHEWLDESAAEDLGSLDLVDAGCIYVVRLADGSLQAWQGFY